MCRILKAFQLHVPLFEVERSSRDVVIVTVIQRHFLSFKNPRAISRSVAWGKKVQEMIVAAPHRHQQNWGRPPYIWTKQRGSYWITSLKTPGVWMGWLSRTVRVFLTRHRTGPVAMRRVWVSSRSSSLLCFKRPKMECSISKWWVKIHLQVAEWMNETRQAVLRGRLSGVTQRNCSYLSGLSLSSEAFTVRLDIYRNTCLARC